MFTGSMAASHPKNVVEIVDNFKQRKDGLRRALTTAKCILSRAEVDAFFGQCHPDHDNLCLYGHPDGSWSVELPAEEVPAELPEPCLGINFARDGMARKDWLALVAVHSDSWLFAVAFYYGAKLTSEQRKQLFLAMNQEPTLFEEVNGKRSITGSKRGRSDAKRLATDLDISTALKGRRAEIYWPDDQQWYSVEVMSVNVKKKNAMIRYDTGENEELDLEEIIQDKQMYLLE